MTLYSLVLFIHVVSAIGLFVGFALEGFVTLRIRWAQDAGQMRFFVRAFERLRWIFIPSLAGILPGGLYLAFKYGSGKVWIPAALIATLAIMLIGGLVTGRKMNRLKKALGEADATFAARSAIAKNRWLPLSFGLRTGLALGIVFLMTAQPDLWPSVFALVAGCAAGLLIASGMDKISSPSGIGCGPGILGPLNSGVPIERGRS